MRTPLILATLCLVGNVLISRAQAPSGPVQGPEAPEPPPTYELDKQGKRTHIDFSLKVKPISDVNLALSQFANRKLLVFYFSAKCPHCQHAAPYVQKLADDLAAKGYVTIACAIKYNSDDDIRSFIRDYSIRMPVFQDDDRVFGENYGTGSIPLLILVNPKGEYIRYKTFDPDVTPKMILDVASSPAPKK
jgi:thiol-disulfide isomerase/thioredoxin